MTFGARRRESRRRHTRDWVRCLVRSDLVSAEALLREVTGVIALDHHDVGDPKGLAAQWISEERSAWDREASSWTLPTDFERLQGAFAALRDLGFLVLEGCADHWEARDALRAHPGARGVLWFVPADVWHAIDEPMLEINVWHPTTANASAGDELTHMVIATMAQAGLATVFDEGRLEVAARWQKRPVI